jgi:ABC-2 type transport system ATP-binding protein
MATTDRFALHNGDGSSGESTGNGIEVEGLVREFKKGPRAVDGIDLSVSPGEIYGFLGPNGAGKSTTVHMLTTLLPPTAGSARVAGHDIIREGAAVRNAIGVALQEAALDQLLTGREHMRLQAGMHGWATRCSSASASPTPPIDGSARTRAG